MKTISSAGGYLILGITLGVILGRVLCAYTSASEDKQQDIYEVVCADSRFVVDGVPDRVLIICAGDSVVWNNKDTVRHTVVSDDTFNGVALQIDLPAGQKSRPTKFAKEGTYKYHCSVHPNMQGTITVVDEE